MSILVEVDYTIDAIYSSLENMLEDSRVRNIRDHNLFISHRKEIFKLVLDISNEWNLLMSDVYRSKNNITQGNKLSSTSNLEILIEYANIVFTHLGMLLTDAHYKSNYLKGFTEDYNAAVISLMELYKKYIYFKTLIDSLKSRIQRAVKINS